MGHDGFGAVEQVPARLAPGDARRPLSHMDGRDLYASGRVRSVVGADIERLPCLLGQRPLAVGRFYLSRANRSRADPEEQNPRADNGLSAKIANEREDGPWNGRRQLATAAPRIALMSAKAGVGPGGGP